MDSMMPLSNANFEAQAQACTHDSAVLHYRIRIDLLVVNLMVPVGVGARLWYSTNVVMLQEYRWPAARYRLRGSHCHNSGS